MNETVPQVDVVGVGLNATDTIIQVPHFPSFNSKTEFVSSEILPGGQVASAMVACAKWGLATRYVGKIGDDAAGRLQRDVMAAAHVEAHWFEVSDCQSQVSFILVDQLSGERTIIWRRDPRLGLRGVELRREWITQSKLLHVDGHDCESAATAARWARESAIPVTADFDNIYPGTEALLENVDFLISSREFPGRLTGQHNLLQSLPALQRKFGCRVTAATLGMGGVLAWDGERFHYARSYAVQPVDTTGAGDIFHAGFAYSVLKKWDLPEALEFSCAAAGLACMAVGARAGIATLEQIHALMRDGRRNPAEYAQTELDAHGTIR